MEEERPLSPKKLQEDEGIDVSLRPQTLAEFIGQEKVKGNLKIFIEATKKRGEALDHCLFYGPPGLGKTTLAYIIAKELGVNVHTSSGPILEKPGDLAAILTNLQQRDVLFVDEIHRLNRVVEEILYPAMEDFQLDIIIGQGPSARSIKLDLPRFTLIGATTRAGLLTSPLRERFGIVSRLDYYSAEEINLIINRSSKILDIKTEKEGAQELAKRSRGTPRIANRLLKRVRDFAQVKAKGVITGEVALAALEMLEVDALGFDQMDRKILLTIIDKFRGGPVGIETISTAISEEKETIEDIYEPFLIQQGFLSRTARGRVATPIAYQHLGRHCPIQRADPFLQPELFNRP